MLSSGGTELINRPLPEYCTDQGSIFTRSRPYLKKHLCHVEQKNWAVDLGCAASHTRT